MSSSSLLLNGFSITSSDFSEKIPCGSRAVSSRHFAFHGSAVLDQSGRTVALGPVVKRPLDGLEIFVPSLPGLERFVLQRAPVRKTELPGFGGVELVDSTQMLRSRDVILSAG